MRVYVRESDVEDKWTINLDGVMGAGKEWDGRKLVEGMSWILFASLVALLKYRYPLRQMPNVLFSHKIE